MCSGSVSGPGDGETRGGGGGEERRGWVVVWAGSLPQLLFPSLFRTCQAGSQGVMWKCGWLASTWLSLRTCLCREETPGLITLSPDTLHLLLHSFFFSPYLVFPLLLCYFSFLLLPLQCWRQKVFFSPFSLSLPLSADFWFSELFPWPPLSVCNWLFFCLWSPSFTLFFPITPPPPLFHIYATYQLLYVSCVSPSTAMYTTHSWTSTTPDSSKLSHLLHGDGLMYEISSLPGLVSGQL